MFSLYSQSILQEQQEQVLTKGTQTPWFQSKNKASDQHSFHSSLSMVVQHIIFKNAKAITVSK